MLARKRFPATKAAGSSKDSPPQRPRSDHNPPTVARVLALQGSAGNRAVDRALSVQRDFGSEFIEKKARERDALTKWNMAGSGRNQGLIHVIDYAKARPPKRVAEEPEDKADNKLWATFEAGHPLSGLQLLTAFGKNPSDSADLAWLAKFAKQLELLFPAPSAIAQEISSTEASIRLAITDATDKRAAANSEPVKALKESLAALKTRQMLQNRWVIARDDSKKGRVEQVEAAMEKKTGQRPTYAGNEVLGVTGALDELVSAENTTARPAKGFGEQLTSASEWVRTAEGTADRASRWEQKEVTFTGSAYEEESTPEGLRAIKWGQQGRTKYSTVMGGK